MKKTVSVIVAALIVALSCGFYSSAKQEEIDGCNWMSAIRDDASIADLSIPGTHDSAAQYVAFGIKSRCQSKNIPEQLNCGARFFDIRLERDGEKLKLVHSIIDCRKGSGFGAPKLYFDDVIAECISFLKNNPKECVFFFIKEDNGSYDKFNSLVMKYINENRDMWYTQNSIPNLGEVRGKIVLLNRFSGSKATLGDSDGGVNLTNFPDQGDNSGSYQAVALKQFGSDREYSVYTVQDRYKYSKADKWEKAVKITLDTPKADGALKICFLSTAAGISPEVNAKYVNNCFMQYKMDSSTSYGVVLFDFINASLAEKIYSCNTRFADSSAVAKGVKAEVPQAENGKLKFLDWLWNFIIKSAE